MVIIRHPLDSLFTPDNPFERLRGETQILNGLTIFLLQKYIHCSYIAGGRKNCCA